jgi:hypothetical protein
MLPKCDRCQKPDLPVGIPVLFAGVNKTICPNCLWEIMGIKKGLYQMFYKD